MIRNNNTRSYSLMVCGTAENMMRNPSPIPIIELGHCGHRGNWLTLFTTSVESHAESISDRTAAMGFVYCFSVPRHRPVIWNVLNEIGRFGCASSPLQREWNLDAFLRLHNILNRTHRHRFGMIVSSPIDERRPTLIGVCLMLVLSIVVVIVSHDMLTSVWLPGVFEIVAEKANVTIDDNCSWSACLSVWHTHYIYIYIYGLFCQTLFFVCANV